MPELCIPNSLCIHAESSKLVFLTAKHYQWMQDEATVEAGRTSPLPVSAQQTLAQSQIADAQFSVIRCALALQTSVCRELGASHEKGYSTGWAPTKAAMGCTTHLCLLGFGTAKACPPRWAASWFSGVPCTIPENSFCMAGVTCASVSLTCSAMDTALWGKLSTDWTSQLPSWIPEDSTT